MKREDVYKLIDVERNYQDSRWDGIILSETAAIESDKDKSVAEWIIYMEQLLNQAKAGVYSLDKDGALEFIRKTTAVGVACMEYNETPSR